MVEPEGVRRALDAFKGDFNSLETLTKINGSNGTNSGNVDDFIKSMTEFFRERSEFRLYHQRIGGEWEAMHGGNILNFSSVDPYFNTVLLKYKEGDNDEDADPLTISAVSATQFAFVGDVGVVVTVGKNNASYMKEEQYVLVRPLKQ